MDNDNHHIDLQAAAQSRQAGRFSEIGTTGLESWSGLLNEAYNSDLYWPGVASLYGEIWRSDPELTTVRNLFSAWAGQLSVGWELPAQIGNRDLGKPNDADLRAMDFAYSALDDMEGGFAQWLDACITKVPFFGWGWWEVVPGLRSPDWRPPGGDPWRSQETDGLIGIRKLAFRHYKSFYKWELDDATGRLGGMWQQDYPNPQVLIPLDRSLHVTYGDHDNPEGLALMEAMWRLQRYKKNLEIVQGIGYEHTAGYLSVSVEDAEFDANAIRNAARAIMTAQEGNYAAWPKGTRGELIDVPFGAGASLLEVIRYYSILKLALFGMQWIAMSSLSGTGSFAAVKDGSELALTVFHAMAEGFIRQADEQIGARLFEYPQNRAAFAGMTRRPRLVITERVRKSAELTQLSQFISALSAVMPLTKDDAVAIRRESGFLPENFEDSDPLERPEPAQPEPTQDEPPDRDEPETDAADEQTDDEQDADMAEFEDASHAAVEVAYPCPLCGSGSSIMYPGHNGLLVCAECGRTFDPAVE